jgi:hypothetical protein
MTSIGPFSNNHQSKNTNICWVGLSSAPTSLPIDDAIRMVKSFPISNQIRGGMDKLVSIFPAVPVSSGGLLGFLWEGSILRSLPLLSPSHDLHYIFGGTIPRSHEPDAGRSGQAWMESCQQRFAVVRSPGGYQLSHRRLKFSHRRPTYFMPILQCLNSRLA